jgi:hypothetical protein
MTDTDCGVTASRFLKERLPYYTLRTKNRLYDTSQMIIQLWTTGHLYIQLSNVGCHHCILVKVKARESEANDHIVIYDSFINHRMLTVRAMPAHEFWRLLRLVLNGEALMGERCTAYNILFMPPDSYLIDWTGIIERVYLDQCN